MSTNTDDCTPLVPHDGPRSTWVSSPLARGLRLAYATSTYAIMFVLVRVWGEMMPTHSYYYSMTWAVGFIPCFIVLFLFARFGLGNKSSMLDSNWPMLKQSVFVAFTFAINYLGVSTAAPHVGGPAQVILSQLPAVFAAILTTLVFKRRYGWLAWFGILTTIAGTVVQMTAPGVSGTTTLGWAAIFMLGNLPGAVWAVAFEGLHKFTGPDGKTNTMELRMIWTNFFLILWLVAFIPFFGVLGQPPLENFSENFWQATLCTFTGSGGLPEDHCLRAGWVLGLTIVLASLQAHSQIVLSRDDSGVFATLALSLAPFLADAIFPVPALMGPYVEPVSKWDAVAVSICIVGVVLFVVAENKRSNEERLTQVNSSKIMHWFHAIELPEWLERNRLARYLLGPNKAYQEYMASNSSC